MQRQNGVTLNWQVVESVKSYHVLTEQKGANGQFTPLTERQSDANSVKLADLKPGHYRWRVASIDPRDQSEKASEWRAFAIDQLPAVEWADSRDEGQHEYTTPTPSLKAQWKAYPAAASYRYRLVAESQNLGEAPWQSTKQNLLDISLPSEGRYAGVVEALDAKGQAIAASPTRIFAIRPAPLLPGPLWSENAPEILKSDLKGNLSFGWQEVDGAKKYLLLLETEEGQLLEQRPVERNTASLARLKPGAYQVKLKAVDGHQRPGLSGVAKKLHVPNVSNIRAPKIKSMKVK